MKKQLDEFGIPFAFFDAVEGSAMTAEELTALGARPNPRRNGAALLPGELGCIASFVKIFNQIAHGTHPYVCVIEDDIILTGAFKDFLDENFLRTLPAFDILRLQHRSNLFVPLKTVKGYTLLTPFRPSFGSRAQIYTPAAASKLIPACVRPQVPIDSLVYFDGYVPNLRIVEVSPALSLRDPVLSGQTNIDPNRARTIPPSNTLRRRLDRRLYELQARFRIFRNFIRQRGFSSLFKLRRPLDG